MWLHAEVRTLGDIPRYRATVTPDAVALVEGERSLTYRELDDRSDRVAAAIVSEGIGPGSHIGMLAKNCLEFWELWFGAAKAGCALALLNWRLAEPELAELVDDAGTPLLVAGPEFGGMAARAAGVVGRGTRVLVLGEAWDTWLAEAPTGVPLPRVHGEDTALLAYTSGTTGRPKGAQLSHRAFVNWFLISSLEPTERWSGDDVVLMVMPSFHLAGSWVSLPGLYHGGTVVVLPAFEPGAFLEAVERYRPTITCLVPTAIGFLLDHPATAAHDFSSLRRLLYAGSSIGAETLRRALTTFGCDLSQFYGTSETYIISLLRPEQHAPSRPDVLTSCGAPVPLVDVRIVDIDGLDLPAGEIGEVLVRSPMVFNGYWNQPEATAAVLADGWYHTGDLGRRDEHGLVYLVDRLKDMIVTGGENVYSVEVERALAAHPDVALGAVVGVPDERWGEQVTAYVVARPGATLVVDALLAHCRSLIAGYKVPKEIHIVEGLPMTPSGKVRKNELRARVASATPSAPSPA